MGDEKEQEKKEETVGDAVAEDLFDAMSERDRDRRAR